MPVYTLEPLTSQNSSDWDSVITQCPHSSVFHGTVWRNALADAFKQLRSAHLYIKQEDTVIGGLPAFVFEPIPTIKLWYSMPWNLFGAPQIIESAKVDIASLFTTIETYLETASVENGWCELCWTLSPIDNESYADYLIESGYERTERFTHLLKTNGNIDALWQAYNKRVRGAVRKAQKSGVTVIDTDSDADLTTFYNMYLSTVKRLGGTPKPYTFMKTLLKNGVAKLAIATYQGTIIAGLLYLYFNRTVTLWCEASLPEYLQYRPNNAIFHHIITWACKEGYEWVDFGASPPENKGLIAHKEQYRAKKTDFCSYTKVVSPFKRSVWTRSEGALRKIYTWLQ